MFRLSYFLSSIYKNEVSKNPLLYVIKLINNTMTNEHYNKYKETITPDQNTGEPATLEFSGPLHKFFPKKSKINFYVKDEFPLLLVSEDRKLVKAPFTSGN